MDGGVGDILALNELLTTLDNRDDYAQEQPRVASVTPASLAGTSAITVDRPIGQIQKADPKAIWQPEEVPSDDEDDDAYETRARPVFEILYKQSVMTEDVFLGLSDKDPSSAHCEAMVVRIECPRHRREDIELDVKKQKLLLQSATLKLALYLPYPVRPHDGDAKWDQRTQVLTVSLPIIRDEWALHTQCIAAPMRALAVLEEIHRADPASDRLELAGLGLERLDASALAFIREKFPLVKHLDLHGNALTLLPFDLGSYVPQLTTLDVRENPFPSIPELSEALASCASLHSLFVTLHNKTDEKVLRVMLPTLALLNDSPIGDRGRLSPLSLDLALSPTSGSSSSESSSPNHRWLDTPPSTTARAVRPVRSPQEKRELRIHLAQATKATTATKPRVQESVKPTELPATISDEHTDWRKLLKQTTAKREAKQAPIEETVGVPETVGVSGTSTTRAFIAELKAIVRGFQKPLATGPPPPHEFQLLDQLERKIDQLALQLRDLDKQPETNDGHVVTASLAARWRLVEAGTLYAAHRANSMDKQLGTGLFRLLQTQTQVVEALLQHVHEAIYAQQKWEKASTSQQHVAEQQKQQMKLLLDVAETLEKDLETLQTKYEQEKTQREQAEAASLSLQSEYNGLKQQLDHQQQISKAPTPVETTPPVQSQRSTRIRKRQELAAERPASPKALTAPRPASPPKPPAVLRSLTLKQLVDLIHCILTSKTKYDARISAIGAPPETVEQHMYTYLNQRFGLQPLIIEYAAAIWKGCQLYTRQDNDVAMFHALLRNQVDEDFVGIKTKLQRAVRELLRAYFHAKHPLKSETVIQKLVDARLRGGAIYEDEWTELLLYLYDPSDSSILLRLVKRKAEACQKEANLDPKRPLGLPFAVFEKLLTDYQLQGRLKLLAEFRRVFGELDRERVGVLTRAVFRTLVTRVAPRRSDSDVGKMLERVDPFEHDSVTFSDAVRCLLPDIRQHSVNKRTDDRQAPKR